MLLMRWNDRLGRRLKLHDLHIFMMVAETGSMGKAAEFLSEGRGDYPLWSSTA
jgi:hypothetical protein